MNATSKDATKQEVPEGFFLGLQLDADLAEKLVRLVGKHSDRAKTVRRIIEETYDRAYPDDHLDTVAKTGGKLLTVSNLGERS